MGAVVFAQYISVALIGAAVGTGEIVSRYRDNPLRTLRSTAAGLYLVANAAAAIIALYVIKSYGIQLSEKAQTLTQTFAAGFGAMAMFRTSLFTARIGSN